MVWGDGLGAAEPRGGALRHLQGGPTHHTQVGPALDYFPDMEFVTEALILSFLLRFFLNGGKI